jgi:hypothetical protein
MGPLDVPTGSSGGVMSKLRGLCRREEMETILVVGLIEGNCALYHGEVDNGFYP